LSACVWSVQLFPRGQAWAAMRRAKREKSEKRESAQEEQHKHCRCASLACSRILEFVGVLCWCCVCVVLFCVVFVSLLHALTISFQLTHLDKDFRYMACSDLTEELKREAFKLDSVNEGKVRMLNARCD
jgi:hypothetical protein